MGFEACSDTQARPCRPFEDKPYHHASEWRWVDGPSERKRAVEIAGYACAGTAWFARKPFQDALEKAEAAMAATSGSVDSRIRQLVDAGRWDPL